MCEDEDDVFELFGQLWSVPSPKPRRRRAAPTLVWIRKDLFEAKKFTSSDCFPARVSPYLPAPKFFSFAKEWSAREGRNTYAEIVKMAGSGRGGGRRPSNPRPGGAGTGAGHLGVTQGGAIPPQPTPVVAAAQAQIQYQGPGMLSGAPPGVWSAPQFGQWPQFFLPQQQMQHMMPQQQLMQPIGAQFCFREQFFQQPTFHPDLGAAMGAGSSSVPQSGANQTQNQKKKPQRGQRQRRNLEIAGEKANPALGTAPEAIVNYDMRLKDVICYNCGEPAHYVGKCEVAKLCFICHKAGHHMDVCPDWLKPLPAATYLGSANAGLGFFHIECSGADDNKWLNLSNVGTAVIEEGSVTIQELKQNFSEIWKTNWPWQIRKLSEKKFLVRFPPHKKVKDLSELPSINLKKKGVTVSFMKWEGEIDCYAETHEVWINVIGLPPKWITWKIISQVASIFGVLTNVDWHEIFRSFFKNVTNQVAVRDHSKNPKDRLVEIEKELYLLQFSLVTDHEDAGDDPSDPSSNNGDDDLVDDNSRKGTENEGRRAMDTDKSTGNGNNGGAPTPANGGTNAGTRVTKNKPVGQPATTDVVMEGTKSGSNTVLKSKTGGSASASFKRPVDNISAALLTRFEEEIEDDIEEPNNLSLSDYPLLSGDSLMPVSQPAAGAKTAWGPMLAPRMSNRIKRDGRNAIQRAADLLKVENLEVPKPGNTMPCSSNSFAVLADDNLHAKASDAGISLGRDQGAIMHNIAVIKSIECGRMANFKMDNPDAFLPDNIDISEEEIIRELSSCGGDVDLETHTSEYSDLGGAWVQVSSKRSSKRKLCFHGSRINLEC